MPAVTAGLTVIRRSPAAVAIWGLITVATMLVGNVLTIAILGPAMYQAGQGGRPSVQDLESMMALYSVQYPIALLSSVAYTAIIVPAIFRAVMKPEDNRHFYLRFSIAELHVGVIYLVLGIGGLLALLVCGAVLAIPFVGIGLAAADGGLNSLGGVVAAGTLVFAAMMIAFTWVFGRLWMGAPMSVAEKHLRLLDGWAFTRGYGWRLVGMAVLAGLLGLAVYVGGFLILVLIAVLLGGAAMATGSPVVIGIGVTLAVIVCLPIFVILMSAMQIIFTAPWAKAYQILAQASGRLSQTVFD